MLTGTLLGRVAHSVRQSAVCSSQYCPRSARLLSSSSAVRASDHDNDNDRKEPTRSAGKPYAEESPTTIESILDSLFSNVQTHVPTSSPSSQARTRDTNSPHDARHRTQNNKAASSSAASTDAADLFDSLFGDHGGPRGDGSSFSGSQSGDRTSTGESSAGSVFADLLGTDEEEQPSLKYYSLYPPVVRRWVMDGRIPPGRYQGMGQWSPVPSEAGLAWDTTRAEKIKEEEDRRKHEAHELFLTNLERRGIVLRDRVAHLPDDLVGAYRFGIEPSELDELEVPEKLRRVLSFEFASQSEITQYRKRKAVERWQRFDGDTGSPEAQVASMTVYIDALREHCRLHRKDKAAGRRLKMAEGRRTQMMKYLKRKNVTLYFQVIDHLNIADYAK